MTRAGPPRRIVHSTRPVGPKVQVRLYPVQVAIVDAIADLNGLTRADQLRELIDAQILAMCANDQSLAELYATHSNIPASPYTPKEDRA